MAYYKEYKERCSDCISLIEKDKCWFCEECDCKCEEIDWCPYSQGNY